MKKVVIVPVKTIGDALILMILANHFSEMGYDVTIMHDSIIELKSFFPKYHFKKYNDNFAEFDHIIYQHDNAKAKYINELNQRNNNKKFSILYFTYKESKHGPLGKYDISLSNDKPLAHSLAEKCKALFSLSSINIDTGIDIPKNLTFKKHPKRILLHPSSNDKNKCWSKKKFIQLCKNLKNLGYQPVICVAPYERDEWLLVHNMNIDLPLFLTLNDFANYLYESSYLIGNDSFAVHLASIFNIEHILLAKDKKLSKIWQPGWKKANIIFPSFLAINFKPFRLRENHFQKFISVKKVLKKFNATFS